MGRERRVFRKKANKGANGWKTELVGTNNQGQFWVPHMSCLSLSGWLYTPETWGKGKILVPWNRMTQFPFLSSMVVTEKYLPGIELYKCCLRTNSYFQVIKELSFFSYCSIISNSRKALGFQEHSHDFLPSNRGYILFCCDGDRTF